MKETSEEHARRGEVHVQKGYSGHRHVVNLNCTVCIPAKHMRHGDVVQDQNSIPSTPRRELIRRDIETRRRKGGNSRLADDGET